jgi:hypothetical protein
MTHATTSRHDSAGMVSLAFALAGAPVAWAAGQVLKYALAVHPCFPEGAARTLPLAGWSGVRLILLAIDAAAALTALAACLVGWRRLRRLPREGAQRFLATAGIVSALGFLAAIVFEAVATLMSPLCAA